MRSTTATCWRSARPAAREPLPEPDENGAMRILAVTNLFPNPYEPGRAPFTGLSRGAGGRQHGVGGGAPISWTEGVAARLRGGMPLPPDRLSSCDGILVEHPRYLFPPKVGRTW